MARTGSDYVLDALASEGVEELFGLIGEGNAHFLDRTNDHDIPFRYARHEQVAVSMADGYARTTGNVGVCTLTHGPGVTNGATGLAIAERDNVPLVVLVGDVDGPGHENSLQYLDHLAFTDKITVYGTRAASPAELPGTLANAFDTARTKRGPVVVELPGSVQEADAPDDDYNPIDRPAQQVRPDSDRLEDAVDLLSDAEAPLVLAGGGAAQFGDAVADFAEHVGAPIVTTFYAKGMLDDGHPYLAGIGGTFMTPAAAEAVEAADVVLALGAKLSGKTTRYGALYDDADLIQVDIEHGAIATHTDPDVKVVGDAESTANELRATLPENPERAADVRDAIASADDPQTGPFDATDNTVDPAELTVELASLLPGEEVVTVDSGNNTGFPPVYHDLDRGGRMLANGNFGTMGYALPAALGASIADNATPSVCYIGDGAFLQVIQDVETAVRFNLPVLVVVYNDESYGIIRHRQNLDFDRATAAEYESADFAAIARGFGADAVTVRDLDDLDAVADYLDDPDGPMVVDAHTNPAVSRPGFPPY